MKDIDQVIGRVVAALPSVRWEQLHVTHPADDDGLWFFHLEAPDRNVQAESTTGMCPFIIENNQDSEVAHGLTCEETARKIVELLTRP